MSYFHQHFPQPEDLVALEPEELAGFLLEYLHSVPESQRQGALCLEWLDSSSGRMDDKFDHYPHQYRKAISRALMKAFSWLEQVGLIAPWKAGYYFITRRGDSLKRQADVDEFRKRAGLPKQILHSTIVKKAWPGFLRGEYETAVFQAFKEVEVAVRTAGNFAAIDLGTPLMRKAFDQSVGPLTDSTEPVSEREALAHLFAGAIGRFKNPSSHRHVAITDAGETFEMLALASHLLRIVDDRRKPSIP